MRGKILTLSYYSQVVVQADFSPTSNAMPVYLFTGTDVDPNPNTFAGGSGNKRWVLNTTSTLTTAEIYTYNWRSGTANAIILQ